jgi:hypothetical protein
MFNLTSYYVFRRRVVKAILKFKGWRFRGQDPPSNHPHIIFVNPVEGALDKTQTLWMPYLTTRKSIFINLSDLENIQKHLALGTTIIIRWREGDSNSELESLFKLARTSRVRISACAWDTAHKAIKFHSHFKPSPYPERDMRYLSRFFVYFKRV